MKRIEILSGSKFGNLTIEAEVPDQSRRLFLCNCLCGKEILARLDHLRSGHTTSCGQCGLEYGGERRSLKDWAESAGIKESTLRARLKLMSLGEAIRRGKT